MKTTVAVLALLGLVAGGVFVCTALYAADEPAKAKEMAPAATVTVKGEVVDLNCFLTAGARGEKHKECAIACAKAGNPIGLVDDKDVAYILLGKDKVKPDRETWIKEMAGTVTVKGTLAEKGGLKAIVVESMEPVK